MAEDWPKQALNQAVHVWIDVVNVRGGLPAAFRAAYRESQQERLAQTLPSSIIAVLAGRRSCPVTGGLALDGT